MKEHASSSVITTSALTRIYQQGPVEVLAVNDVSLSIEPGEFTALVGPSGSGKTTLLNMIGGLDRPTSGSVSVDGTELNGLDENALIQFRLHHIGFVFQAYNLIPVLSAAENIEFIMLLQKASAKERKERTQQLLRDVGLSNLGHARPTQLSGGQQQRVAVARALASKPAFVLADEPTANLDSQTAESLLDVMEQLNRDEGMTFVFSTHDPRVIARARRVVTLVDGRIDSDVK
jgi:putative ABC transport system ATP-binding protein